MDWGNIPYKHQPRPVLRGSCPTLRGGYITQFGLSKRFIFRHALGEIIVKICQYFCAGLLINFPKTGQDTFTSGVIEGVGQGNHSLSGLISWFSSFAGSEDSEI